MMNIRKIIREEVDDFDWINDIPGDIETILDNYFGLEVEGEFAKGAHRVTIRGGVNKVWVYKNIYEPGLGWKSLRNLYNVVTKGKHGRWGFKRINKELKDQLRDWAIQRRVALDVTYPSLNNLYLSQHIGPNTGPR